MHLFQQCCKGSSYLSIKAYYSVKKRLLLAIFDYSTEQYQIQYLIKCTKNYRETRNSKNTLKTILGKMGRISNRKKKKFTVYQYDQVLSKNKQPKPEYSNIQMFKQHTHVISEKLSNESK